MSAHFLNQREIMSAHFFFGLPCRIGLLVLPLAGAVSGKLSRGACSKWGGAGSDFPVPFLSLDRFGRGGNNYLAGLSR